MRILSLIAVLAAWPLSPVSADPAYDCDRLTAGAGTDIPTHGEVSAAVAACRAAVAADPAEPRLRYQFGLALEGAGDPADALAAYRKAAAVGYPPALTSVARFHEHGILVAVDLGQALALYRKAATLGDAEGAMMTGYFYETGQGVPPNPAESARFYLQAAEGGVAWAANAIAGYYELGTGVAQDQAEAVRWYRVAADAGDPTGLANLGRLRLYGTGVPKDEAEAARLFRLGADAGDLSAAGYLAHLLHYGIGVTADPAGAEILYRQVITETGSTAARNSLAWLFAQQGIKLDEAEMLAREAVRLTPGPPAAYVSCVDTLAWVLFKQGRFDEAATLVEGIVTIEPRRPPVLDHLGDIYAALGRLDDARAAWRAALAIEGEMATDPDFDRAATEAKLAG